MKKFIILIWIIISGIGIASFVPHLFPGFWLADIFSHFKIQYLILLIVLLLPALLLVKKAVIYLIISLILLGWNSWFLLPLYQERPNKSEASNPTFSIFTMNLLASNTNYSGAIDLIREKDPDVVVLLELSHKWEEQMVVLKEEFPHRELISQWDNFGIGILSKIPMTSRVIDFNRAFPPSIYSELQIDKQTISLMATRPVPPVSQKMFDFRNEQLHEIGTFIGAQDGNFILAGDLNTSSFSNHFQDLLETGDMRDSRNGFGVASSWPTEFLVLRTTLDHFLLKGEMQVLERTTEKDIGSDHLPIYLKVRF